MPDGVYGSASSSAPAANRLSCFAGSGTVTVTHDLVIDTATYVVPSGGETCQNVIVQANATVTGGKLTVLGGSVSVAAGKTARFENEVSFGADGGSGTVAIAPAAGAAATFVGKLTGPHDIEIFAADRTGVVRFAPASGVTSDFDGNLTVVRGEFHAAGDSSLGSTAGFTRFVNTMTGGAINNCIYFDGMTTSETIYLSRGTVGWNASSSMRGIFFTADCTFNGPILPAESDRSEFGWDFADNITINFNGGLGTASNPFGSLMGNEAAKYGTTFNFNTSPHVKGNWFWMRGVNNMNCQVLGAYSPCFRGGTYHLNCANVFVTESGGFKKMRFENNYAMTFDLVQGVQTFTSIDEKASGNSQSSAITSSTGQTFELRNASEDTVFRGSFTGNVNLRVLGDKTVSLYGQSDSSGTLSLSNAAKVVFAQGARWTGKVAFQDDSGSQTLTLDNGGMTVSELWVDGERLPNGEYGSAASGVAAANQRAFLAGTGVLTVGDDYGVLVVNGTGYAVAAGGETYSGVVVSNNAAITGGKLTLLDGAEIVTAAGRTATFACEVAFGTQGNYPSVIAPEAGATNRFTGKLTGPADIEIRAANQTGAVYFTPASGVTSDFDGNLTVVRGEFHAAGDSALGSTAGYTYFVNTRTSNVNDNRIFFDGMNTSERIYLSRGSVGWNTDYTIRFTADCTFNGLITSPSPCAEYGWYFADGITLSFNGGLGSEAEPFSGLMGSEAGTCTATINFNSSPWASGNWYWKGGTNEMNSPLCGNCSLRVRGGYYHLNCANAFLYPSGSSKALVFENGDAFTFDLVTGSQKFASLSDKTAGFSDKAVFTSATGQDVHLDASSGSYVFRGRFTGNVNLSVDAAQTLTLTNRSTSTGTLSLTNGAQVVFTPTGSWAGRIAIAGNGSERLFVSNQVHATQLVVGGQTLAPGWYGPAAPVAANRLSCIGGDGVLAVGMDGVADGVWTAGAGSSATGIELGGNWASGAEPDGASGLASATFATSGTAAGITHDVFWRRVVFSSDVPFFRLFGDRGITLAEGMSVASDATQNLSYEVAAPITTIGKQTWTIPSTNATLKLTGDLHGAPGASITCNGAGTYEFSGANSDTAADIVIGGSATAYPKTAKAFGSTDGATTISGGTKLILDNFNADEPFLLQGASSPKFSLRPGTNVLGGRVSVSAPVYIQDFGNRGRLVFSGGIDFNVPADNMYFQIAWHGNRTDAQPFEFEVAGVAITNSGSHSVRLYNEGVCDVIFSVAGNRLTGTGGRSVVQMTRNEFNAAGEPVSRLFCKVPQVFDYDATLLLGYATKPTNGKPYCGFIDLCGGDQGFAAAFGHSAEYQSYEVGGKPQGAYSVVTSSGGSALLCSRHTDDASTWWTFTGAAGYRMEGTGGITFRTSSESTGALCVTNGTMTIPAGVTWKNCAKVEASDNGTFCLEESRAFGPGTEVRLSGNGKMNLASGVQATAGFLFLDGNPKPLLGEWGSAQSGAAHTSAHFTGTGRIRFGSQMIIIFR